MNPLEIKFIVRVELDNGMIITKDFSFSIVLF